MKKMILATAAMALIIGITKVKANTVSINQQPAAITFQQDTTAVKIADLPDPVKATLQSDALKAWTPVTASLVKSGSAEYYSITVKKDADQRFVKIDKAGKIVQ